MEQLSKIVMNMTKLNGELDGKISGLNSDIEKLNTENFQLKSSVDHVSELERNLDIQVQENTNLLKQVKRLSQYHEYFKGEKISSDELYSQVQTIFNKLEGRLRTVQSDSGIQLQDVMDM
jgi:cell division protein FtsL